MNRSERNRNSEKPHFSPPAKTATDPLFGSKSGGVLGSPRSRSLILELPDADFLNFVNGEGSIADFPLCGQNKESGAASTSSAGNLVKV